MRYLFHCILLIIFLVFTACPQQPVEIKREQVTEKRKLSLREAADSVVKALANRNMNVMAEFADSINGVTFSPYSFIDRNIAVILTPEQVRNGFRDETRRFWGVYHGSGDSIVMRFRRYYDEILWTYDFTKPDTVSIDKIIRINNTPDNIKKIWPNARFVEYHYRGSEEFDGMDWQSLRLVFREGETRWRLMGIINARWTI
jgi:hypothetical protein